MLRERSSDTAYYMEHSVCSNFKMYSALILVFSFNWLQLIQRGSAKISFS